MSADFKPFDNGVHVHAFKIPVEHFAHGVADQFPAYRVTALQFPFVLQFDLSGNGGHCRIHVNNPRHSKIVAIFKGAAFGVGNNIFRYRNGQALRNTGALVHAFIFAGTEGQLFDDL